MHSDLNPAKQKIVFRADGNAEIGLGHLNRSLALAEMLNTQYECSFASRFLSPEQLKQVQTICSEVSQLPEDVSHLEKFITQLSGSEIVVLDNYFFDSKYQKRVRSIGCSVVCIDDLHDKHFFADAIINHAAGVQVSSYSAEFYTKFFLGLDYALLRSPFSKPYADTRKPKGTKAVLVCFGGSDIHDYSSKTLNELINHPGLNKVHVVVGASYRHYENLVELAKIRNSVSINIHSNLSAQKMYELMVECEIAICSASTVAIEYMSVGGGLFLIQTADNQKDLYSNLIEAGLAFEYKGFSINLDFDRQIQIQKSKFSKNIKENFLSAFRFITLKHQIVAKKATFENSGIYFNWVNDPAVRLNAYNSDLIPIAAHQGWFTKQLADSNAFLTIFELNGVPVGQLRINVSPEETVITYSVDPSYRNQGLGTIILSKGIELFFGQPGHRQVVGYVKKENLPSIKAFRSLGFRQSETLKYTDSWRFSLEKDCP